MHRLTGLSPPVKYFTDRSKAVLLLWIFYVFSVLCLLCLCRCLFICALWSPAGKGLTSWLSFVVSNCEFVTFQLVSLVRCGTLLYPFLIFAPLLTLHDSRMTRPSIGFEQNEKLREFVVNNIGGNPVLRIS